MHFNYHAAAWFKSKLKDLFDCPSGACDGNFGLSGGSNHAPWTHRPSDQAGRGWLRARLPGSPGASL